MFRGLWINHGSMIVPLALFIIFFAWFAWFTTSEKTFVEQYNSLVRTQLNQALETLPSLETAYLGREMAECLKVETAGWVLRNRPLSPWSNTAYMDEMAATKTGPVIETCATDYILNASTLDDLEKRGALMTSIGLNPFESDNQLVQNWTNKNALN